MSEDALQQLCYMWFHNTYPNLRGLLFHVPNGGSRHVLEAVKMKKIGVVAGVADLLFLWNGKCYCLELKTATGRQSKKQQDWQNLVQKNGMVYLIIRNVNEFQTSVKTIIKGESI
tara:strand:+ start:295 stop:639 length:345 start_codon:yes stop_codon:yes gene_type:complete